MTMAIVLPIAVESRLVGSGVLVDHRGADLFFCTSLHLFGEGRDIRIVVPPHGGNCSSIQKYPLVQSPALPATVVATDPFADLAILRITDASAQVPALPAIAKSPGLITVGTEIVVLGYPFAPLGSLLETWSPAFVTALARRQLAPNLDIDEIVLSAVGHPGSSGSAVVGRKDGVLYGILRGTLAPPEVLRIGDVPIATDTSVTFATSAHLIPALLDASPASEAKSG